MTNTLSLYEKVLIVKWYYQSFENYDEVRMLFNQYFPQTPALSLAFRLVIKAFEETGSVIEEVLCGIKEEPDTTGDNASLNLSDIEYDVAIKEEPFEEEDLAANMTINTTDKEKSPQNPDDSRAKEKCNICFKIYSSEAALSRHLRKHRIEKKYNCPVCDQSFSRLSALVGHRMRHVSAEDLELWKSDSNNHDRDYKEFDRSDSEESMEVRNSIMFILRFLICK